MSTGNGTRVTRAGANVNVEHNMQPVVSRQAYSAVDDGSESGMIFGVFHYVSPGVVHHFFGIVPGHSSRWSSIGHLIKATGLEDQNSDRCGHDRSRSTPFSGVFFKT